MNAPQPSREAGALEAIGHLQKKICLMWGSPELDVFISRLIMDSRDGARQGLPMEVGAELLFLAKTNKIIRAIDMVRSQKVAFKDALHAVDEGDQKRLETDAFDNPLVSRDTIIRNRDAERRTGSVRRTEDVRANGPAAMFGQMIFKLATSKALIFLIIFALTLKVLWPVFFKAAG